LHTDAPSLNLFLLALSGCGLWALLAPGIRNNRQWRAMVTPLASIIGSGFLVVAPLLAHTLNSWAGFGMLAIVTMAWFIGGVIRFNIRYVEARLSSARANPGLQVLDKLSGLALGLAYVISVAFYIRLLAAFVLQGLGLNAGNNADLLTTAILAFIGIWGLLYGLRGLENLEKYAVSVKLSIILAVLAALAIHAVEWLQSTASLQFTAIADTWQMLRRLAGMLLVVQGFETSRYLSTVYAAQLRITSMRRAQLLAAVIYIVFIILMLPLLQHSRAGLDETAIIGLSAQVAAVLPVLLVIAAVMSQFSAALADVLGAGGLLSELAGRTNVLRATYLLVTGISIVIVWTANIFEIIALASRAFALYYLLQTLLALAACRYLEHRGQRLGHALGFSVLALLLLLVVGFALPVE